MEKKSDNLDWKDTAVSEPKQDVPAIPAGDRPDEFDILLCMRVLLSYWWVLAPLSVFGAAGGVVFCLYSQPVYQAYCRFEVFQNAKLRLGNDVTRGRAGEASLWRHILIMKSGKLQGEISREMEEKWSKKLPRNFKRFKLRVAPVKEAPGSLLDISMDSFSDEYSLEYIQKLIEGYQRMRREEMALLNDSTLANLRLEMNNLSNKLEKAQNDVSQFEAEHNIYFAHEKTKSDRALLGSLMRWQSQLRTKIALLEAQFPFLNEQNPATIRDVLDLTNQFNKMSITDGTDETAGTQEQHSNTRNDPGASRTEIPEWRKNEAAILRLNSEYENLLKKYKPRHPVMIALADSINLAKHELKISAEISLKRLYSIRDALAMQEKALLKTAKTFRMEINLSAGEAAEYDKLKSREEHLKRLHDQVFTRYIDGSASSVDQYYSRIVDGPVASSEPVWPVKWKIISLFTLGTVGFGAGLILLSYFVKVKLYDYHTLEQSLKLKCLSGVPKFKLKKADRKNPLSTSVVLTEKSDFASECYRSLRTNIEDQLAPGEKIVLITSPDPGEGKTFTSLNLAVVFSWSKKKVLVIDGDFRRMTFRKLFKDAPNRGLADCLTSTDLSWSDCVVQSGLPNIDYLPAGHMSKHITELLALPRLSTIFKELCGEYDLIILDSAPVNRVVDTIVLSKYAHACILVAKAGKTKTHSVRYCFSRLGSARIIGYILNNIDAASRKYGYYSYGYSYYSTYHQYKTYYKSYYGSDKAAKS